MFVLAELSICNHIFPLFFVLSICATALMCGKEISSNGDVIFSIVLGFI